MTDHPTNLAHRLDLVEARLDNIEARQRASNQHDPTCNTMKPPFQDLLCDCWLKEPEPPDRR